MISSAGRQCLLVDLGVHLPQQAHGPRKATASCGLGRDRSAHDRERPREISDAFEEHAERPRLGTGIAVQEHEEVSARSLEDLVQRMRLSGAGRSFDQAHARVSAGELADAFYRAVGAPARDDPELEPAHRPAELLVEQRSDRCLDVALLVVGDDSPYEVEWPTRRI